jgi:hypothetical protein
VLISVQQHLAHTGNITTFHFSCCLCASALRKEFEGSSFWNSKTKNSGNCTQELTSMIVFVQQQLQKKEPPSQTHANMEIEEPENLAILFACMRPVLCVSAST